MKRKIIFLLVLTFTFSLASAETTTNLNITNSPVEFTNNIPDLLIIMNQANIDVIDLDDYFEDLNGDVLTFLHTALNNITVTINSENKVSFYPDTDYIGTQSMQFNASDGPTTATSNTFQVSVGLDTQAPQWSNPRKNKPSVYQNYHVTFDADWTDNTGLKEYIFSIDQGTGWRNQTTVEFTGTSNKSNYTIQISASPGQNVTWTFYATDIYGNAARIDTQTFTVRESTAEPGKEYEGEYDYNESATTSTPVSYGTGTVKAEYFEEGVLAKNLEVDTRNIRVSMKQGTNLTRVVKIINTGNTNIDLTALIKGIEDLATLSDTQLQISPGESYELLVEFAVPMTKMPDQYFGFLTLNYEEQISIPIIVDVRPFESQVTIEVNLTKKSKVVKIGEDVVGLIIIKNLKDISSETSQLYYAIKNFKGDIIESSTEDIILTNYFEEQRSLTVPKGTPDDEYIFYARIISQDSMDLDSEAFLIGARFKIILMLKKFLYPFLILLLILIIIILYIIYERNKRKKKLLELYLLLNELRSLVKKGKSKEAMEIYKRIKLNYGQHVSKNFMEDESKLKEELSKFSKVLTKTEESTKEEASKEPIKEGAKETKEEKEEKSFEPKEKLLEEKSKKVEEKKEESVKEEKESETKEEKPAEPKEESAEPKPEEKPAEPKQEEKSSLFSKLKTVVSKKEETKESPKEPLKATPTTPEESPKTKEEDKK